MKKGFKKSWILINGALENISFEGDSSFRFPKELVQLVIEHYSSKGDWILDPFAGFGTVVHVAQDLERNAVGFEINEKRAAFAQKGLKKPNSIINNSSFNLAKHSLPQFDLVFTSPTYLTVRTEDDPHGKTYFDDLTTIFEEVKNVMKPSSTLVVEVSNIRDEHGVRPLAWQVGELLSNMFVFQGEIIRCNKSGMAGPGFDHSYLLVYGIKI